MVTSLQRSRIRFPRLSWDRGMTVLVLTFVLFLPLLDPRIYAVDSVEYYAYLPSLLFDGDLDFTNEYTRLDAMYPRAGIATGLLNRRDPLSGLPINVAPIGTAILWAPFFLLTHAGVLVAQALGMNVAADGFGPAYIRAIAFATACYGLAGLLLCYRLARRFTGIWPATVAVLLCWLCSPILFYMYVSPPWSHVPALFITALFIVFWLETYGKRTTRQWLVLGLLGGLLTLCREQLGLFMLLPALESLFSYESLIRNRSWTAMRDLFVRHLLFLAAIAVALVPQFLAYRFLNGRWGPSSHVSGKLDWLSKHFLSTLIDPAHGALLWTPIWFPALLGLALLWRRDRRLMLMLVAAFIAQSYLNGAFLTWHLSGAFGFRRLIEATPIFVLGLALLLERLRLPRLAVVGLGVVLLAWNLGLIAQWALPPRPIKDGLVWDGMLQRQLAIPSEALSKLPTLIFERCKLVENGNC